jgi:1-acyl-sn-glycerol-3-phosphate acyltransferase
MLKALYVFYRTFRYLVVSYLPGTEILVLKKQWADEILAYFGLSLEISGFPPQQKPVILLGNHISFIDIIVVMAAHPEVVFLAKKEVGEWPIIGPTAKRVGTLFVDRSAKNKNFVRQQISDELLRTRSHLVVFPSGTTTLDEGLPWKKGMFEISQEFGIPIQTFKVVYSHPRVCAYIDDDTMLGQMKKLFAVKNKKVKFTWLNSFTVAANEASEAAAERVRQHVVQSLRSNN